MKFIESKARALTHPIFGNIVSNVKTKDPKGPKNKKGSNFATLAAIEYKGGAVTQAGNAAKSGAESKGATPKCLLCNDDHWIVRCRQFKRQTLDQRLPFVRSKSICENCLHADHLVRLCPMDSFCKIAGCQVKHSTYLHPKDTDRSGENNSSNETSSRESDGRLNGSHNADARNGYINVDGQCGLAGAGVSTTALAMVPVKVKERGSDKMVSTYAFLYSGSNTSFCTHGLMQELGAERERTTLTLTTLGKQSCVTECLVLNLEVFDLEENNFVELPTVFSTPQLPVNHDSIPQQEDVNNFPHLKGIKIAKINAPSGLLIGNDVPKALEPKEVRESNGHGPYATRTVLGWTINRPLGRKGNSPRTANIIKADNEVNEQFKRFCKVVFSDSVYDNQTGLSKEDLRAISIMEDSVNLKEGHYEIALPWKNLKGQYHAIFSNTLKIGKTLFG